MRHLYFVIPILGACVAVTMLFQNCAEPLEADRDLNSVSATAPFAFETKVDHIAYMSCSNMVGNFNKSTFFTFKAAGYGANSGVKLNDAFVHAVRNLKESDRVLALEMSPLNNGVFSQLSLRSPANYQSSSYPPSNRANGYADFWGTLSTPAIGTALVASDGTKFFPNHPTTALPFEDQIYFGENESIAQSLRDALTTRSLDLTLNYSRGSPGDEAIASTRYSATGVYGSGFTLQFRQGGGFGPNRALASVAEYNLFDKNPKSGAWSCPEAMVFKIVPFGDVGIRTGANCDVQNPGVIPAYDATIRKFLPPSSWIIDYTNRCAVLKEGLVNYCSPSNIPINYTAGCSVSSGNCPHYVSICQRN